MAAVGGLFFIIILVFLASMALWLYTLVDVLRRPDQQYAAAGQTKLVWLLVVLLGHVLGSIIYLAVARPQLERAATLRY
jgi:Phospholipase_D-nuclease N-terminal